MMWKPEERKSTGKPMRRWEKMIIKKGLIKKSGIVQSVFMRYGIKTRSVLF
jgi:hypothetical protein